MEIFYSFLFLFQFIAINLGEDCIWNRTDEFSDYPPLLLDLKSWMSILPTMMGETRVIRIPKGTTVVVACPQTTIKAFPSDEVVEGVCEGGKVLKVDNKDYDMMDLSCKSRVKESIEKKMGTCAYAGCSAEADINIIGFHVQGHQFYPLIEICFNYTMETGVVTSHLLRGESVNASDSNPSRPGFKSDTGYFTVSPATCYEQDSQIELMQELLGDPGVIDPEKSHYFARGHLSPDADFMTEMESDATYYFINVVPQWQSFNNGNWKAIEFSVRKLASMYGGRNFKVWTGGWNILALDDINGNPQDIYLGLYQDQRVIPAPEVSWKVVYENSTNRGVALIGLNNPYLTSFPDLLCPDICESLPWITFDTANLASGGIYCCTVQTFHQKVPISPDLGNAGLLDS